MGLDRETIAQVLVSTTAVALFIVGLVILSQEYGTTENNGGVVISPDGGLVLVAFIALFIVAMPIFGYALERMDFDAD